MAFKFRFNIEEQPDAQSFILYDISGDYSAENIEGWGIVSGFEKDDVTEARVVVRKKYTNNYVTYFLPIDATLWEEGIEFFQNESGKTFFEDGVYEVEVFINGQDYTSSRTFGFFAIKKAQVMVEALAYNPALPRRTKDLILDKMRLLDNMYYATETDQIQHFEDNLEMLKRLD